MGRLNCPPAPRLTCSSLRHRHTFRDIRARLQSCFRFRCIRRRRIACSDRSRRRSRSVASGSGKVRRLQEVLSFLLDKKQLTFFFALTDGIVICATF